MADDPKKGQVQFNTPPEEVLRERTSRKDMTEAQRDYQAQMAARKAKGRPHGGAPGVQIPPLNAEPIPGAGTMHQQAEALRDPSSPLSPAYNPQLAMQQAQQRLPGQQRPPGQQQPGQQPEQPVYGGGPFAALPPEAQQDPRFIQGMGSMIAGNQPQLQKPPQHKRAPVTQDPNQGDGYKPHISDETKASMSALAEFQTQAEVQQRTDTEPPKKKPNTLELGFEHDEKEMQDELREMLGNDEMWTKLSNPTRRKEIESRLTKLDITDVIIHGEIRQTIPVVPGKFEPEYRSVSGGEDLVVKRMMADESGGDRYLMDKYTLMQLTLALVAINNAELPPHLDAKKQVDETLFLIKFEKVCQFPLQMLADLGCQYVWFDDRVRDLFVGQTEALKNS